jgi:hypothetical protein
VVAIDLPAPGLGGRGVAHDAHPVGPLAELDVALGQLPDRLVEPHDVARGLEAGGAEGGAQDVQRLLLLHVRHVLHGNAVAHEEHVHVAPGSVLVAVHRERGGLALLRVQGIEVGLGGGADGSGGDAGRLDGVEAALDGTTAGNALEGVSQRLQAGFAHALGTRVLLRGEVSRRDGVLDAGLEGEGGGHGWWTSVLQGMGV